ncbi:MAG: peptidoglycan-associated lipoprotein Pal [Acidobacteriota bacterium]|nr:peptidoglycan-associated lipoprotein Pal [Acidobacteriota bacterium]MDH3786737.1 peptidoglycan-associated lipoprotein Pal [Acidobacteriota bacterium]
MSKSLPKLMILLLALALVGAVGCKKPVDTTPVADTAPTQDAVEETADDDAVDVDDNAGWEEEKPVVEEPVPPTLAQLNGQLQTAYFDFDKFELSDATRATIQANAGLINDNPDYGVVVGGHCDERGTLEYNISLGEKRARAVRDYLSALGVDRSRVRIVTYGEERPADRGHGESAWAKNRRAEFKFE